MCTFSPMSHIPLVNLTPLGHFCPRGQIFLVPGHSVQGHFGPWSFRHGTFWSLVISALGSFQSQVIWFRGRFGPGSFQFLVISAMGPFISGSFWSLVIFAHGHFGLCSFCSLGNVCVDILVSGHTDSGSF